MLVLDSDLQEFNSSVFSMCPQAEGVPMTETEAIIISLSLRKNSISSFLKKCRNVNLLNCETGIQLPISLEL